MQLYGLLMGVGIGLATLIGSLIGFSFRKLSHRMNDMMMGFAAGVMLAAAVFGLIMPSMEDGSVHALCIGVLGVLSGALFVNYADKLVPHLHTLVGIRPTDEHAASRLDKVLLFVLAIAMHNFPEGIAVGVGFGGGEIDHAFMVAIGIALQNIPEGLVVIFPLLSVGMPHGRILLIALFTGLIEIAGTVFGMGLASLSKALLPFLLAFAGGTMLYIVSDEIIPETHSHGFEKLASFSLIIGFLCMVVMDVLC